MARYVGRRGEIVASLEAALPHRDPPRLRRDFAETSPRPRRDLAEVVGKAAFVSPSTPPEILLPLLALSEFMERNDHPLPIPARTLADVATQCGATSKALHFREAESRSCRSLHTPDRLFTPPLAVSRPSSTPAARRSARCGSSRRAPRAERFLVSSPSFFF